MRSGFCLFAFAVCGGHACAADRDWAHFPGFHEPGLSGIAVGDFDGNGTTDAIVTGYAIVGYGSDSAQVAGLLTADTHGRLSAPMLSALPFHLYPSATLAMLDDGTPRWVSAGSDGELDWIVTLEGVPPRVSRSFVAPLVRSVAAIADINADGRLEVVATVSRGGTDQYPAVYDYESGELQWAGAMRVSALAAAQLDDTPSWELILSADQGLIVDGATYETKWIWPAGFGSEILLGNFGENPSQITFATTDVSQITVFGTHPFAAIKQFPAPSYQIAKVPGPGRDRIAAFDGNRSVGLYDPVTGSNYLQVPVETGWRFAMRVADLNGDGGLELIYGVSHTSGAYSLLRAVDVETLEVKYSSLGEGGPHSTLAVGDISGQGREEVVYLTRSGSPDLFNGPVLRILDGATGETLRSRGNTTSTFGWSESLVGLAQMDADPALEIVVVAMTPSSPTVAVLDGETLDDQWRIPVSQWPFSRSATDMALVDVNEDGVEDIILAVRHDAEGPISEYVVALDGTNGQQLWLSSGAAPGPESARLTVLPSEQGAPVITQLVAPTLRLLGAKNGQLTSSVGTSGSALASFSWGSATDCRIGILDQQAGLDVYACDPLALIERRQLPAGTEFFRPIGVDTGRFLAAAGSSLYLVDHLGVTTRISPPLGERLGAGNRGALYPDAEAETLDLLIGSAHMVTRRHISIGAIFADDFE